jgi:hypothetical protein
MQFISFQKERARNGEISCSTINNYYKATTRLDTYYAAVAAGGTNDSNLLREVTAIRTAIDDYRNAAENYVGYLEEQVRTSRNRISEVG